MTHTSLSTSPASIRVPAAGRYRLDPGTSVVTFRTRHLFGLGTVTGTMAITSGEISIDPAVPHAAVTATISPASFSSGNRARDRDVRSPRFLHVHQYPDITFRAGTLSHDQGRWVLDGELTVRQVTSPVTLAISSVEPAGAGFRARATTRIDRCAYAVTAAKGGRAQNNHSGAAPMTRPSANLNVRIINTATGELLRQLTLDPARAYQPTGRPPGPAKRTPRKTRNPGP
jgi:polyisoprenoid-binding protein YceI